MMVYVLIEIISVLFVVYGIIIFLVSSGTKFYVFWILSGLVGFCFSEMGKRGVFRFIPQWVSYLILLAAVIVLSAYIYIAVKIIRHFHDVADNDPDYLIVLGCHVREDGPSVSLKYRLIAAGEYMRKNKDVKAVLSGGQGPDEPISEAEAMRDYLLDHYLLEDELMNNDRTSDEPKTDENPYINLRPDSPSVYDDPDITMKSDGAVADNPIYNGVLDSDHMETGSGRHIIEKQSKTTGQNLRYSFLLTGDVPVCIVTNNFHMYRALMLAHSAGYRDVSGIAAPSKVFFLPNNITREVLAVLKDRIVSGLDHYQYQS